MIEGTTLRDAIVSASAAINGVRQKVDALNVFPVPDGDTGTNMSMTIGSAAKELERLTEPTVTQVAATASAAMLRGARGNSGVILALLFRGLAKGLKGKTQASGADLANALDIGVTAAYKAVMKPTEGTILTVAREAAAAGKEAAAKQDDPLRVWRAMCDQARSTLARTPDLLPMLKKAGVVDAGGQGLCIIMEAMRDVFAGEEVRVQDAPAAEDRKDASFAYCTEFVIARSADSDLLKLRAFLESIGGNVEVEDDGEIIRAHLHTDDPGAALHEAVAYGEFESVKVENLRSRRQNNRDTEERETGSEEADDLTRREPEEEAGFVAVGAGEGVRALLTDLGCLHVVSGGQTMNPSTDDILRAVEATPAKTVYVLPNNKNIILAAEQAAPLADRDVYVLPTCTVSQGIAALLAYDADADVEKNLIHMTKAAENVSSGQITYAARDSDFDGGHIREGEILAMENGKVAFVDFDVRHAALKLTRNLVSSRRETSFITIIYGQGVTEKEAESLAAAIAEKVDPEIDITTVNGGQPVYYYMISAE